MSTVVDSEPLRPMSVAEFGAFVRRHKAHRRAEAKWGSAAISDAEGASLLLLLEDQDTGALADGGWLSRLDALTRLEARVAALKATAIAAYDDTTRGVSADLGHDRPEPGDRDATAGERRWHNGLLRSVSDDIALVLELHRSAASARILTSWHLVQSYPATHTALATGDLTERAAFAIVDELNVLEDESKVRAVEARVLDWARKHPLQRIKQIARREVAEADATAAERHHRRVKRDRRIVLEPGESGTAHLILSHDGVLSAQVMNSLTKAALKLRRAGDERTTDQLRADLAIQRLLGQAASLPGSASARASTSTGSASTEEAPDGGTRSGGTGDGGAHADPARVGDGRCDDTRSDEAHSGNARAGDTQNGSDVAGGPRADTDVVIHATAEELRALLEVRRGTGGEVSGPTWLGPLPQAALRDALSRALRVAEAGTTAPGPLRVHLPDQPPASDPDRYVPSRGLDRWIRERDRRCRFPGCNRPAKYTDIDHREAFAAGGRTTADNLHCLCRHHHRLKHRGGWKIRRNPDGCTTWISPTGRTYLVEDNDP